MINGLQALIGQKLWIYTKDKAIHADLIEVGEEYIKAGIRFLESDEYSEIIRMEDIRKIVTGTGNTVPVCR